MKRLIFILLSATVWLSAHAQKESKDVRAGNKLYEEEKYTEAEVEYRKGLQKNTQSFEANFNLGNALFRQEKYDEALKQYNTALALSKDDKQKLAAGLHNVGNALLTSGKVKESIDAYKAALKNNPKDDDTRYNLAFAQEMLKNQEQQNQQNQEEDPILKRTKELVAQMKYQAAYDLLKDNEKKNPETYREFMERILNVIKMN